MVSQNCLVWHKTPHDIRSVAECGDNVKVKKLTEEVRFSCSVTKKNKRHVFQNKINTPDIQSGEIIQHFNFHRKGDKCP